LADGYRNVADALVRLPGSRMLEAIVGNAPMPVADRGAPVAVLLGRRYSYARQELKGLVDVVVGSRTADSPAIVCSPRASSGCRIGADA
jgi:hypothetical protein